MAVIPRYMRRPTAILKMPQAIAKGLTPTAFLKQLRKQGLGYRYQRFLRDWHNVAGTEARKGRAKYVRKDLRPTMKTMVDVDWLMDKEYMFKFKVFTRSRPDEPLTERFVNVTTDKDLTWGESEELLFDRWSSWEKYKPEDIVKTEIEGAWHRLENVEPSTPSPFQT